MRSPGGAVSSSGEGIPRLWLDELADRCAWISDPDGRAAVMNEMAYAARRRQEIEQAVLVEMLEFVESARWWGLNAQESGE
ncbi:hypothetical protein I5P84_03500 [Pseudomonas mosselii]|nr:hypothetical protein [Pseudomonas mosselii]MBH3322982.1 hypothetical protein [Pseudomonas mosselii]